MNQITLTAEEINRAVDIYRLGPLLAVPADERLILYGLAWVMFMNAGDVVKERTTAKQLEIFANRLAEHRMCNMYSASNFREKFFNKNGGVKKKWWSEAESFTKHMAGDNCPCNE